MSKEDVQAYSKLLKFQKKRYGASFFDFSFIFLSLIIVIGLSIITNSRTKGLWGTVLFALSILYVIAMLLAFIDYAVGLGIFKNIGLFVFGVLLLLSVIISSIVSFSADSVFAGSSGRSILAVLTLIYTFYSSVVAFYYMTTSSPSREGRDTMITRLSEIQKSVEKTPLGELGTTNSEARALKWIQFKQRKDGIWGESNPLLETSEVLRMFYFSGKGMQYSWKSIIDGNEEIHTVEQTYYLILEALDTAAKEPNYNSLLPLLIVAEIDSNAIQLSDEIFNEFKEELDQYSEWEFIKDLEKYDEKHDVNSEIPIIFIMAQLFYIKGEYEYAQKCADVIANTFAIIINRSNARFSQVQNKEISSRLLGLMYNTLLRLVRGKQIKSEPVHSLETVDLSSPKDDDLPDTDFLSDFSFDNDNDQDFVIPAMPGMDIDSASSDSTSQVPSQQIKLGTSMASIRNYLRSKQQIDGSWGGRIDITVECLRAVSDQEATESEYIKSGVQYLLALQEKNGSWQDDISLTSRVITILNRINKSLAMGGLSDHF